MLRRALHSRLAGLHRRWSRRLGSEPTVLDSVEETTTISDQVDIERLTQWLPDQWSPAVEIVRFRGKPLAETLRITNRRDGARITLRPVDLEAPTERVEIYTRRAPTAERTHRGTADSLAAGLTEATRLAAKHRQRGLRARSSSHRSPPAARQPAEF